MGEKERNKKRNGRSPRPACGASACSSRGRGLRPGGACACSGARAARAGVWHAREGRRPHVRRAGGSGGRLQRGDPPLPTDVGVRPGARASSASGLKSSSLQSSLCSCDASSQRACTSQGLPRRGSGGTGSSPAKVDSGTHESCESGRPNQWTRRFPAPSSCGGLGFEMGRMPRSGAVRRGPVSRAGGVRLSAPVSKRTATVQWNSSTGFMRLPLRMWVTSGSAARAGGRTDGCGHGGEGSWAREGESRERRRKGRGAADLATWRHLRRGL